MKDTSIASLRKIYPHGRISLIAAHSTGFLYLVSLTGATGPRAQVSPGLEEFIARVRTVTSLPLAVSSGSPPQGKPARCADWLRAGSSGQP